MACMVDLPTPTAPFVVFRPSRQEMVEMMSREDQAPGYDDVMVTNLLMKCIQ